MSSEAPIGYDVVILSFPSTADLRSRSSVCSLSLIVADETLLSANWAMAVEVETCLKPPLPRKNEENTTARTTTRPTQNHTERKIFLRSIHRCRAPGEPGRPVDPPDRPGTPPATRAGTPALGGASSRSTVHRGSRRIPGREPKAV